MEGSDAKEREDKETPPRITGDIRSTRKVLSNPGRPLTEKKWPKAVSYAVNFSTFSTKKNRQKELDSPSCRCFKTNRLDGAIGFLCRKSANKPGTHPALSCWSPKQTVQMRAIGHNKLMKDQSCNCAQASSSTKGNFSPTE